MKPIDYLTERGEKQAAFARRAGIHQRSLNRALKGNCTMWLAKLIVQASREQPTPSGGTITFEDLAGNGDVDRKRGKAGALRDGASAA